MMNRTNTRGQNGFSILEVVIGIFIFVVGLLALSALQGALTRSMADAKVRTTAANIAERLIESQRGFTRLISDTANPRTFIAYNDIVNSDTTEVVNGITYTIDMDVTDYYYQLAGDNLTTTTTGALASTYKQVEITVSWGAAQNFRADEGTELTAADLGSGNIVITAAIPALITSASARVADESDDGLGLPPISYTPGLNPEIVSLALGSARFKESLTPEPEVFRENLETRFDVITYAQGNPSLFLRREEFVAVSCECELQAASSSELHRRPVIWAGDEYVEPEPVSKPFGLVIESIQQSRLCDTCCKDHHDSSAVSTDPAGDAGVIRFKPFGADDIHKHYTKSTARKGDGTLDEAGPGDSYVEACRLVRKDGFFRLAQDFRLEGLNVFAEDYLITSSQVADYSGYVTGETSTHLSTVITQPSLGNGYQSNPPALTPPGRTKLGVSPIPPADLTLAYTFLPTSTGAEFQQLRSRSIYIDYYSNDLRWVINCINLAISEEAKLECKQGDVELDKTGSTNILEIVPFFEVQTTFLNEWDENPIDAYIEVTNEAVKTDNTHSRGRGHKIQTAGSAMAFATAHRGVLGMTATDPIDNLFEYEDAEIQVVINTDDPPDPAGKVIVGTIISYVPGVQAANVVVSASDASCNFTNPDFACFVPSGAFSPMMRLDGYQKKNTKVVVCSNSSTLPPSNKSDTSGNPFATFSLTNALEAPDPAYVIWLDVDICSSG